ncbi:MAG: flagellar biosynthesis regulator FlaF, partial [Pseudomonadota bacterium]
GKDDLRKLIDALDWNRRVWSALALDCSQPENQLPVDTRAGIISLSMFVSKYTSQVAREGEDIETLIEINRSIMQGLAASAGRGSAEPENGSEAAA